VHDDTFITPAEQQMPFTEFLDIIDSKTVISGVAYVQKQNSNFTEEFSDLTDDVDLQMTWATQAFGRFTVVCNIIVRRGQSSWAKAALNESCASVLNNWQHLLCSSPHH